ncbi:MAG: hypothetical protein ABSC33_01320 [Candidatus Sulfotelmatobacter sp.]|jgi:hypothetical protein
MQYGVVVLTPETNQHIIIKADPRFYQPLNTTAAVKVPDGGSGWAFILTAVTIIGWSATRRFYSKILRRGSAARL